MQTLSRAANLTSSQASSLVILVQYGFAIAAVLMIVEGALPQLQMVVSGGQILMPTWMPLALVSLMGFILLLIRGSLRKNRMATPGATLTFVLLVCGVNLFYLQGLRLREILHTYGSYYLLLVLIALFAGIDLRVKESAYFKLFVAALVVNAAIAGAQFATNSAILPTESGDGSFVVHSSIYAGVGQRAFGLFNSGLDLGMYAVFMAGWGAALCRRRRTILIGSMIVLLSGFICYATLTRLVFIEYLCGMASVYFLASPRWRNLSKFLPLLWLLVGIAIAIEAFASARTFNSITATDSMNTRFLGWVYCLGQYTSADWIQKILGYGMVPEISGRASALPARIALYPIDNLFLIVLLYVGIAGVLAVGYYLYVGWRLLHRYATEAPSALALAVAAYWSTLLMVGIYNYMLIFLAQLLLVAVTAEFQKDTPRQVAAAGPA